MTDKLSQLKKMTTVVADTGDFDAIAQYQPEDATTNPSLILKAAKIPTYQPLIEDAIAWAQSQPGSKEDKLSSVVSKLHVNFGCELLKRVPGYVSTETDPHFSFDKEATIRNAEEIIEMYSAAGADTSRVLIKIASTWEGIKAAEVLEQQGIKCNMTLIFGLCQATACAEVGATLISPFVGRILDWYKNANKCDYAPHEDPGVLSVSEIYKYMKKHEYKTIVMGASFRNIGEIEYLSGCDRLTISPELLNELQNSEGELPRRLSPDNVDNAPHLKPLNETAFRWDLNENAMATEKLADGIRRFAADTAELQASIADKL
tara:strand:+ start:3103 stop:4056 length:954 start_codon:yes stop_codon:yes gene_type:complete